MKGEQGISTMGEKKGVAKLNWVLVFTIVLLVGLALGALAMNYLNPNPLQQYITQRTCNFVLMGDFQTAVCTDGTAWTVSPFEK
jgi:hypothetical protein